MGLFDKLKGEFVDIVEWVDDSNGQTLVWRFPRYQNEIKNGAQLIVRPGQAAIFVDQGKMGDLFTEGRHELSTDNMPLLSTLRGWKHGFNSPFKCEVYFVSTKIITGLKWGTPNPLMLRDPDFGAIRLGAFGMYTLRCTDPNLLLKQLVGTDGVYDTNEVNDVLRSIIQSSVATVLGKSKIPALDLLSNYELLGEEVRKLVLTQIDDEYGLEIPQLKVVNINVPDAVQKALDQRASMGALGSTTLGPAPNLAAYQQYQLGNGLGAAGGAAPGLNLGMGVALAGQMMNQVQQQPPMMAPPPLPTSQQWFFGINGQNVGPLTLEVARQFAQMGQIRADSLCWTQGMGAWQPAAQVPALASLFGGAGGPPPLPPSMPPPMPR
ncbi:MAG: SPFH domain-containing protein [Deltaproteobacteria bacterium]|nr:SPFH domain-containing protein [Deltaproteobacteria bacterium]